MVRGVYFFLNIFNLSLIIVFYWIVFVILLYCISIIGCEDVGLLNVNCV